MLAHYARLGAYILMLSSSLAWSEDAPTVPAKGFDVQSYSATVRIMAREYTDGPDGPALPLILAYTTEVNAKTPAWTPLFGNLPIKLEQKETINFPIEADQFAFRVTGPTRSSLSSGNCAIVLRNNDKLIDFLAMNHCQVPYGSQQSVDSTIREFIDSKSGRVKLGDNQMLVLFEIGGTDPKHPSFDFQDLILLVDFADVKALAAIVRLTPRPN